MASEPGDGYAEDPDDLLGDELDGPPEEQPPFAEEVPDLAAAEAAGIAIDPLVIYESTGRDRDGEVQCRFVWQAVRVAAGPEQFVKARFLFSSDPYWDWWTSSPGVAGAIRPGALIHVCTEEPCLVGAPRNCQEVVHITDAQPLQPRDVKELYDVFLATNPDAVWPLDLLGPAGGQRPPALRRPARPKPGARPKAEAAPPGAAPFDEALGGIATPRGSEAILDDEASRELLKGKLTAARDRFEAAKRPRAVPEPPPVEAAGDPLGGGAKPKKRGLAEVLAERLAKVPRGAGPEPARGSRDAAPAEGGDAGAGGGSAQELATALIAVMKSTAAQAVGGSEAASDPFSSAEGGGLPRGLATKRAHCRKLAKEAPGKLSEATLAEMADFLGAMEGETAVDPTSALVLRWLLTVYAPQNPVKHIGVPVYRELRTLAEAIDLLLQGKVTQALDVLTQRMKAVQVAVGDGHWGAAKWLELIPAKDEPTTLRNDEEEMIRSIELGELKLEELTAKLRRPG